MFDDSRNRITKDGFELCPITEADLHRLDLPFCGDSDLDDFFLNECMVYERDLMAKSYKLCHQADLDTPVGIVSLLNDALPLEARSQRDRNIPFGKRHYESFPAVKIGRLGIWNKAQGRNLGSLTLSMLKKFFLTSNRTGCRFLTVDAYNSPKVLAFYERNKFVRVHVPNEEEHKLGDEETVTMFYNLEHVELENGSSTPAPAGAPPTELAG